MVRKDRHACGVAAELLAAFKLPCRKDARKHACKDGKGGWAADSKTDHKGLALISVRHSFCLGAGVEGVGLAVGLANAGEVVEVKHFHSVFSVEPENLLARGDAALLVTADAPQDLVLP